MRSKKIDSSKEMRLIHKLRGKIRKNVTENMSIKVCHQVALL